MRAIGSHGQTLRHRPQGEAPFTLQLGDANVIAEATGIDTVADFRRRDVAAGGQGAPLVPAFHAATLADAVEDRAVLNLGGIANLTLLPVQRRGARLRHRPGQRPDGRLVPAPPRPALRSRRRLRRAPAACDDALLARLLDEPWLALPPPKSTGRDQFHLGLAARTRIGAAAVTPADVQATLARFTARTVADALRAAAADLRARAGVRRRRAQPGAAGANCARRCRAWWWNRTGEHGLDPDFVEAMAFAWLAREFLAGAARQPGRRSPARADRACWARSIRARRRG